MALGKDIKFIKNGIIELLSGGGKKAEIKSVWVVKQQQFFKCSERQERQGVQFYFNATDPSFKEIGYSVILCSDNEQPNIETRSNVLMGVSSRNGVLEGMDIINDFSFKGYGFEYGNGVSIYKENGIDNYEDIVFVQDTMVV